MFVYTLITVARLYFSVSLYIVLPGSCWRACSSLNGGDAGDSFLIDRKRVCMC